MASSDGAAIGIAHRNGLAEDRWAAFVAGMAPALRRRVLLAGVSCSDERAHLLRMGFGEVMGLGVALPEMAIRAERLAQGASALPALRHVGALTLDLLARDGRVGGRRLGLHPREFALIWRLADQPGEAVAKADLLGDVWQLAHVPDTNSLAVHVSRLRAKLAAASLDGAVRTLPGGAYALVAHGDDARPAIPMLTNDSPLADHIRVGTRGAVEEDSLHELHVPRE